jgi:hypothetical protein
VLPGGQKGGQEGISISTSPTEVVTGQSARSNVVSLFGGGTVIATGIEGEPADVRDIISLNAVFEQETSLVATWIESEMIGRVA